MVNSRLNSTSGEVSSTEALSVFNESQFDFIPPYFLTHWKTSKSFFLHNGSLLAFEKTKKHFIISGEPAGASNTDDSVYKAFLEFAHKKNKKVCGFYVGQNWNKQPFSKKPLGTSFRIDLNSYDLNKPKAKEVRRSLRKGQSQNFKIVEKIETTKFKTLIKKWKAKKLPLKLKFFLSEPQVHSTTESFEKGYAIEKNGQYFAFCSTLPYKNKGQSGVYIDHLVYDPTEEKAALSFLVSSLIQKKKELGVDEINLGLNPFAKISPNGPIEKLFGLLYHMPFLYRPKGLHYFKSKFAGQEEPEYFFYEEKHSPLLSLLGMMKTTFSKNKTKRS